VLGRDLPTPGGGFTPPSSHPKSSIEVTICTSSNILVWFGKSASEKSVAGHRESHISSPFCKRTRNKKRKDGHKCRICIVIIYACTQCSKH
jgi:hypothetical protein